MSCENPPEAMRGQFDRPWNYIGDVKTNSRFLNMICKCQKHGTLIYPENEIPEPKQLSILTLSGYQFITDDMLEVMVFFGVCAECQRVYWGKQGPPFRRARAFVPVEK
jgi:hypothetical protein